MKGKPLLEKAKNVDHGTPGEIWDAVTRVFGQRPDLDPCGNPDALPAAHRVIWLPKWMPCEEGPGCEMHGHLVPKNVEFGDGLEVPWHGCVYVNPEFGHKVLGRFMEKAAASAASRLANVIMLAPSKTGLKCWQAYVGYAGAICFIDHRLKFLGNKDPALFDCALILWNSDRALRHRFALELDGKLGQVWSR